MTRPAVVPSATTVLVVLLIAVFAAELARGVTGDESALLPFGALKTVNWTFADAWRIATYWLLHLNTTHLVTNVAALWWLGHIVERRAGASGLLVAWAASVLAAGAVGMIAGGSVRTTGIAVGASGGDCGLLAAALLLVWRDAATTGERSLLRWLGVFAAITLGVSLLPGVSAVAHVGGFIGGGVAGQAYRPRRMPARPA